MIMSTRTAATTVIRSRPHARRATSSAAVRTSALASSAASSPDAGRLHITREELKYCWDRVAGKERSTLLACDSPFGQCSFLLGASQQPVPLAAHRFAYPGQRYSTVGRLQRIGDLAPQGWAEPLV